MEVLERVLQDVQSLSLETSLPHAATAYPATSPVSRDVLEQISGIAKYVLAIATAGCPRLHSLSIISPNVLCVIPLSLDKQVDRLTLGDLCSTATLEKQEQAVPDHVQRMMAQLKRLSLLKPSSGLLALPPSSITQCKPLRYLDLDDHPLTGELLHVLPQSVVELHGKMVNTAWSATPGFTLTTLKQVVFNSWGGDGSVIDIADMLAVAPHTEKIVLRKPFQRYGHRLSLLNAYLDIPATAPALHLLDTHIASGLKLVTESSIAGSTFDPQGFTLKLALKERTSSLKLSDSLQDLQPCFFYTDVMLTGFTYQQVADLTDINTYFPNVAKLSIKKMIDSPLLLAPLERCSSLTLLELQNVSSGVSATELCSAICRLASLKVLHISDLDYFRMTFGKEKAEWLRHMLTTEAPGLRVILV